VNDSTLAQAIVDGGYGLQRIQSQLAAGGPENTTLPLSSAFLLFGQRYTPDSHVFSNVVYDRVPARIGIPVRSCPIRSTWGLLPWPTTRRPSCSRRDRAIRICTPAGRDAHPD